MKKAIILASILLLAAACQKGGNSGTQASTQNQNTSNTQNSPNGWNAYQNAKWGFEIKYPNTFSLVENSSAMPSSYIPVCGQDSKACIALNKDASGNTNLEAAAVALEEINAGTEASCKMPRQNETTGGEITINGTAYASYTIGDAAAGHWLHQKIYRTMNKGVCVQITLGFTGFNRQNLDNPDTVAEVDQEIMWKKLEEVFSTAVFK